MPERCCPTCGAVPSGVTPTEPPPAPRPPEQRPQWARLLGAPFHLYWASDEKAPAYAATNLPRLNLAFLLVWSGAFAMFLAIRMDFSGHGSMDPTEVSAIEAVLAREPIPASSRESLSGLLSSMAMENFHLRAAHRDLLAAVLALIAVAAWLEFRTFIVAKRLAKIPLPALSAPSPGG